MKAEQNIRHVLQLQDCRNKEAYYELWKLFPASLKKTEKKLTRLIKHTAN